MWSFQHLTINLLVWIFMNGNHTSTEAHWSLAGWSRYCFKAHIWKILCQCVEGESCQIFWYVIKLGMQSPNEWCSFVQKLAYGLSLLPKSRGDEDSWSLLMDKILLCVNSQLNDAFQGLEEGNLPYAIADIGGNHVT